MRLVFLIIVIIVVAAVINHIRKAPKGEDSTPVTETKAPGETEQSSEEKEQPSATDYSDPGNWVNYGIGENKDAHLFLICPTVDMNDEFNMSLDDEKTKASFEGALNMERGIYEDSARMFAPYYRQAAMKVYSLERSDWEPYMEIAYSDVPPRFHTI